MVAALAAVIGAGVVAVRRRALTLHAEAGTPARDRGRGLGLRRPLSPGGPRQPAAGAGT
ncbi:hypothetical protein O1L44_10965 [Streptomyces noursei]|nr:hypothetical protein [Streptomyces noursei]